MKTVFLMYLVKYTVSIVLQYNGAQRLLAVQDMCSTCTCKCLALGAVWGGTNWSPVMASIPEQNFSSASAFEKLPRLAKNNTTASCSTLYATVE